MSPTRPPSKRAFSAAASPRNISRKGKKAKRDDFPQIRHFIITTPVVFPSGSPSVTPSPLTVPSSSTPLFPSSSTDFFQPTRSSEDHNSHTPSTPPSSPLNSRSRLDDLHHEAFTSLRRSVSESGEGFVRRMREWEQRKRIDTGQATLLGSHHKEHNKRRDRHGARKNKTCRMDHRANSDIPALNSQGRNHLFTEDALRQRGEISDDDNRSRCTSLSKGQDDMLLDDMGHVLSLDSKKQMRNVSFGNTAMDVADSPGTLAAQLPESDMGRYPSTHCTPAIDFSFTYFNTWSSASFSFGNSSDDESSSSSPCHQTHSGFSSQRAKSNLVHWTTNPAPEQTWFATSAKHSHPPDSVDRHSQAGSRYINSSGSFTTRPSVSAQRHVDVRSHDSEQHHLTNGATSQGCSVAQAASDQAIATLVLALANGSGSLTDYSHVRDAQGELKELEAGALWD